MAFQLFLDHKDFYKVRRGLMITSITLIFLTQVEFKSNIIEIFKLQLGVNSRQIIIWNIIAVIYFLYILLVELPTHIKNYTYQRRHETLDDIEDRLNTLMEKQGVISPAYEIIKELHAFGELGFSFERAFGNKNVKGSAIELVDMISHGKQPHDDVNQLLEMPGIKELEKIFKKTESKIRADMKNLFISSASKNRVHLFARDVIPVLVFSITALLFGFFALK